MCDDSKQRFFPHLERELMFFRPVRLKLILMRCLNFRIFPCFLIYFRYFFLLQRGAGMIWTNYIRNCLSIDLMLECKDLQRQKKMMVAFLRQIQRVDYQLKLHLSSLSFSFCMSSQCHKYSWISSLRIYQSLQYQQYFVFSLAIAIATVTAVNSTSPAQFQVIFSHTVSQQCSSYSKKMNQL